MIQIVRAEDGQLFQVNASLRDIERIGSIEAFLHQETGIDQDAVLAYLSDSRRLTNANLREFAGAQDQTIFAFNKNQLEIELEDLLAQLRVEPNLQPPIEETIVATPPFRPSQLAASYTRTAHLHFESAARHDQAIRCQHEAIRVASGSLDFNVLAIADTFDTIAAGARSELEKQAVLLAGVESDLEVISRVKIHVDFVSPTVRKAIEAGEKQRTLGDYVSNAKMKQVAAACARTHEDLSLRFQQMNQAVSRISSESRAIRNGVSETGVVSDASACLKRSKELVDAIEDAARTLETPTPDADETLQDLKRLDALLRQDVYTMVEIKNSYTAHCIGILRNISLLNNDIVQLPPALISLQTSFRGKNSFTHIQRLHNMLYAYGATVVEIVRRKEFSQFFFQRAQTILDVMAKLSAAERKRRQVYRSEVHGQLPFETKGLMEDTVPAIDFNTTGGKDSGYALEREDIQGFFAILEDLERVSAAAGDRTAMIAVKECRLSLEKMISRMDSLEAGFDKIAERSLLSASRLSHSRRRSIEADESLYQELTVQLRTSEETRTRQESQFQDEISSLSTDLRQAQQLQEEAQASLSEQRSRADRLQRELDQVRGHFETEAKSRKVLEVRHTELIEDLEDQRLELSRALGDATTQTKTAELLRHELAQAKAEFEAVKALESRNSEEIALLMEEQAKNLAILETTRLSGHGLEAQIKSARAECGEVTQALKNASKEKDRLLRAQASEHDRIMRDHIAEADGDRAVLERQFFEGKATQEHLERQLKDVKADLEIANSDAYGLRQELQRVEHELRDARDMESFLRDDVKTGRVSQSGFEQRLESSDRLVAQILDVALAFRESHIKALATAQNTVSHASSASKAAASLMESAFSPTIRHSIIGLPDQHEEPPHIDPSDPSAALEALRAFDHDHFVDAISKTGNVVKKWQKQCKEYRERAKGKISFRNFTKGDLALFLPTKNSVSKPWAAFNVSFPHYFLQATGHLADQLKTREWIVARITSITERVVDSNDPSSNPYGLGDGIKYYMLEVEDWTQPANLNKRKVSSRRTSEREHSFSTSLPSPSIPVGPPELEVEETFQVTHPPNSRLFPSRSRSNSSPPARLSSLSRLLAQAQLESSAESSPSGPPTVKPEPQPEIQPSLTLTKSPSPILAPLPPPSPSFHVGSFPRNPSSPLRPGSRASRLSNASRFSVGRLPLGTASPSAPAKAVATTALSEFEEPESTPPVDGGSFMNPVTPSPTGSASEGMASVLHTRRRTTSYMENISRPSSLATVTTSTDTATGDTSAPGRGSTLSQLVSGTWGFGRKKRPEIPQHTDEGSGEAANTSASALLKRL